MPMATRLLLFICGALLLNAYELRNSSVHTHYVKRLSSDLFFVRAGRYTLNGKYDAASFPDSVKEIGFIKSHGEVDALITMDGEHCVFFRSSSLPTGMFVPGSFGKLTYEWHEANMGTASPNRIKIFENVHVYLDPRGYLLTTGVMDLVKKHEIVGGQGTVLSGQEFFELWFDDDDFSPTQFTIPGFKYDFEKREVHVDTFPIIVFDESNPAEGKELYLPEAFGSVTTYITASAT